MGLLQWFLASGAADAPPPSAPPPPPPVDNGLDIAAALRAAAPRADADLWVPLLSAAFPGSDITTPYRVAAFIGQATAEVGDDWSELAENMNYTSPARLVSVFPSRFATISIAEEYAGKPEKIANRAYAYKLGNGDEFTGDGWTFRGSGLFQLTGREEIGGFAATVGMTPEAAADYCRTPAGAVASACWYWTTRGMNELADAGMWSAITRRLNGAAMEGADVRLACTRHALAALGVA